MRYSLYAGCGEALRIDGDKYYITQYDVLVEVTLEEFKTVLDDMKWCENSWSQELKDEYRKMREIVENRL